MGPGRKKNPLKEKQRHMREAELDLVFALGKLHKGDVASAFVNIAVALVVLRNAMTENDFEKLFEALGMEKPRIQDLLVTTCLGPKL